MLHPDERHDGRAGAEGGFRYRALYLEPRFIAEALGATALPFVREAVTDDRRLVAALRAALADLDSPLEPLQRDDVLQEVADALAALDGSNPWRPAGAVHGPALETARRLLEDCSAEPVSAERLEAATGLDRYSLARQFRARFGTSPHRYLVMRRLDRARALIRAGQPQAQAAAAAGFADQSHMSRHFKKAFGLSPGRWARMSGAALS